ncbi:unnamed protein product [Darwinula stevensoni]|uniref:Gfo/Idh/MocA family oxidoreductase n=1 Tax=Darwinula stevensoni TaxID=69355 RepID=A0A7R9AD40_9CRUS|nr:unnamed protein product [Darwinula stevensoni]CAG0900683.1 unnamed protein product [Darwinula stevensoni]
MVHPVRLCHAGIACFTMARRFCAVIGLSKCRTGARGYRRRTEMFLALVGHLIEISKAIRVLRRLPSGFVRAKNLVWGSKMAVVTALVIGAGQRGRNYACYALDRPDGLKVVAASDVRESAREYMAKTFHIPANMIFSGWEDAVAGGKLADCAIVTTPDCEHKGPAVACANLGYHILLEKPMATSLEDCIEIREACRRNKVMLAVCHILRYDPPIALMKEVLDSGEIGEIVNVEQTEPVGFYHFAHSFVRGNWRKEEESSFTLLTKCCHDVDLILHIMEGKTCTKVSSFGSLHHFNNVYAYACGPENFGSVGDELGKSSKGTWIGIYLEPCNGTPVWPWSVVCDVEDLPGKEYKTKLLERIQDGPYGRCVYECDNDVCDNQTVMFEFDDGSTAALTMVAFTERICERLIRIRGSKGEVTYSGGSEVRVFDFLSRMTTTLKPSRQESSESSRRRYGHGEADYFTIDSFVKAVQRGDPSLILTGVDASLRSHLLTFKAEESRVRGCTIKDPERL